jgi:hypothetical protein
MWQSRSATRSARPISTSAWAGSNLWSVPHNISMRESRENDQGLADTARTCPVRGVAGSWAQRQAGSRSRQAQSDQGSFDDSSSFNNRRDELRELGFTSVIWAY